MSKRKQDSASRDHLMELLGPLEPDPEEYWETYEEYLREKREKEERLRRESAGN